MMSLFCLTVVVNKAKDCPWHYYYYYYGIAPRNTSAMPWNKETVVYTSHATHEQKVEPRKQVR